MKITLVTHGVYPHRIGGMERYSTNVARALAASEDSVSVVHPGVRGGPAFAGSAVEEVCHPWPAIPHMPGHYFLENWVWSRRTVALLGRLGPDAIFVQGFVGVGFPSRLRGRVLLHLHGYESFQPAASQVLTTSQIWATRQMTHLAVRRARLIAVYGSGMGERVSAWVGISRERILNVPNALSVDFEKWSCANPTPSSGGNVPLRIGFIGRDEPRKNLSGLLSAASELGNRGLAVLRIVRDTPQEGNAPAWAEVIGPITDPVALWAFYRSCDVLVLPSLMEGMPTVVLEGMAAGVPVIAMDVGAVRDIVSEETGILVPEPSVSCLRAAIEHFVSLSPEERRRRGANGREKVLREFTWARVGRLTRDALVAIADENPRTEPRVPGRADW